MQNSNEHVEAPKTCALGRQRFESFGKFVAAAGGARTQAIQHLLPDSRREWQWVSPRPARHEGVKSISTPPWLIPSSGVFEDDVGENPEAAADDGSAVETNVGLFDPNLPSSHRHTLPFAPEVTVVVDSPWVKYKGLDLLWLPHEYEVSRPYMVLFLLLARPLGRCLSFRSRHATASYVRAWFANL